VNPFASLEQRSSLDEEMDAAGLSPERYAAVIGDLARINALTLAARPTLAFVEEALSRRPPGLPPLKILDVGFGHGDMLRRIARGAARRGAAVELVGIDCNPRSEAAAKAATAGGLPIRYVIGDYQELAGQKWDIVLSSLVTHHMSDAEQQIFLRFMEAETAVGWLVNDLHRQRLPFAGYPLLATAAMVDPIVRRDGQLSIARSFRRAEWLAILGEAGIADARVRRWFPYRLCVERMK
jgi:2-polyprenyl-3-methyl-5-hydroxy-6-metoxy-1,4-benzoquinol methylase